MRACARRDARLVTLSTDYASAATPRASVLASAVPGASSARSIRSTPTARDLAAAIVELAGSGRYDTWNRTNAGHGSWFDLAAAIFELADVGVGLTPQSSSVLGRPAPRPAWSVLDATHPESSGLLVMPHWHDGLARLLEELRG